MVLNLSPGALRTIGISSFLYNCGLNFTKHYEQETLQDGSSRSMEMHCNPASITYRNANIHRWRIKKN